MLVLFETPAGYAIFKLLDEKKLQEVDNLYKSFESPEGASKVVKLKHFEKFNDTTEALAAATSAVESKMSKSLKKVLKKLVAKDAQTQLAVADAKLGNMIKEKLSLQCVHNSAIHELMRCIRSQVNNLITGLPERELSAMALGLAHSLSRYKLKFSPDKVDTMIVQAISLLDDLDKELNNYVMRCREWYGWHFPELGKIVTDNLVFAKTVKALGFRSNTSSVDLSSVLPEEVEAELKLAAEISMGTEISDEDIMNITYLCEQIIEITEYRGQLYDYLKNRMTAIAPNVTTIVGELVGARLIAHAGSLLNLAKHPASTVQILGAEKALFRALKTKRDTPKYGLIYHASLVGQTAPKNKGKMSRMLAAKTSLAVRVDALGEETTSEIGELSRAKLESRLRDLEKGTMRRVSGTGKQMAKPEHFQAKTEVAKSYNAGVDSTLPSKGPRKRKLEEIQDQDDQGQGSSGEEGEQPVPDLNGDSANTAVVEKKKKKKIKEEATPEEPKKKKIKKEKESPKKKSKVAVDTDEESDNGDEITKKKKKKKKLETETSQVETPEKKKKKKKKNE